MIQRTVKGLTFLSAVSERECVGCIAGADLGSRILVGGGGLTLLFATPMIYLQHLSPNFTIS